jgi:hypothetical protein
MEVHNKWLSNEPESAGRKNILNYSPMDAEEHHRDGLRILYQAGRRGVLFISAVSPMPLYIAPIFLIGKMDGLKWHQTYWFKADGILTAVSIVGNYFRASTFRTRWAWSTTPAVNSRGIVLLGSGTQPLQVIMDILTVAYSRPIMSRLLVLRRVRNQNTMHCFAGVLLVSVFMGVHEKFSMANR